MNAAAFAPFSAVASTPGRRGGAHAAQATSAASPAAPPMNVSSGMQQPTLRPIIRCRPERDRGIPSFRDIRPLAPEMPTARRADHEKPNFLLRLPISGSSMKRGDGWAPGPQRGGCEDLPTLPGDAPRA